MSNQPSLFPDTTEDQSTPPVIDGMTYVPNFLSSSEQAIVLREVDLQPWRRDLKRRVQHYGYRYDYKARRVDHTMYLGELPPFAMPVVAKLVEQSLVPQPPDQLIVNEYLPGQGITAHIDCEPCFDSTITMVSLGWAYEMDYVHSLTREVRSVLLQPGSVIAISGDARYRWLHEIKARKSDRGIPRQRRVSLTFRKVLLNDQARIPHSGATLGAMPIALDRHDSSPK